MRADPPEGCRFAGTEGFEPPHPVLETGALPIELRPIAMKLKTARQGVCPGGGACLSAFSAYVIGTLPVVAPSIDWHRK